MAEDVGQLAIQLSADGAPMIRDAQQAGRRAAGVLGESMSSVASMLPGAGLFSGFLGGPAAAITAGVATIGVAVAGITVGIARAADEIGRMVDLSTELETSFAGLAGLQLAAGDAGVEVEQLTNSLRVMRRNIGNAVQGGGEMADAFRRLNVDARELSEMATDQQFERIAEALSNVANSTERAALTQRLFGRGGAQMTNLIAGGAEAFQEAQQRAEDFGLTLSDDVAGAVESMGDDIGHVAMIGMGFFRQLTAAVAPFISSVAQAMTAIGSSLMPVFRGVFSVLSVLLEPARAFFGFVQQALQRMRPAFLAIEQAFREVAAALAEAFAEFQPFLEEFGRIVLDGIVATVRFMVPIIAQWGRAWVNVIQQVTPLFREFIDRVLIGTDAILGSLQRVVEFVQGFVQNEAVQAIFFLSDFDAGEQALDNLSQGLANARRNVQSLRDALHQSARAAEEFLMPWEEGADWPIRDMTEEAERLQELLGQSGQQARNAPAATFGSQAAVEAQSEFSAQNRDDNDNIIDRLQQLVDAENEAQRLRREQLEAIRQALQAGTLTPRPAPL